MEKFVELFGIVLPAKWCGPSTISPPSCIQFGTFLSGFSTRLMFAKEPFSHAIHFAQKYHKYSPRLDFATRVHECKMHD